VRERVLSEAFYTHAAEVIGRYPVPRSALIMLLHDAQDEVGYITDDIIREVGDLLELSAADVAGVVTFYTMFKRKHPGKYLISLCTEPGCAMFGADDAAEKLRELVGPEGETTSDGLMSWEQVECLAFCGAAPASQVNYRDVPNLTPERSIRLCEALRSGRDLKDVIEELRADAKLPAGGLGGSPPDGEAANA
jgi:NADH-quinone oxidoreductase subunit E